MHEPETYSITERLIDRRDRELRRPWTSPPDRRRSRRSIFINQFLDGLSIPNPHDDQLDDLDSEGGAR